MNDRRFRYTYKGTELEYDVTGNKQCSVSMKYFARDCFSGALEIPTTAEYEGIAYKVTSIADYAFLHCSNLKSVKIPDTIKSIGVSAFSRCTGLKTLKIPNSVKTIKSEAFSGCDVLEKVSLPKSLQFIHRRIFYKCECLKTIKIPESVTTIDAYAFCDCKQLKCIKLPDALVSLGDAAFSGCSSLAHIILPDSIKELGESVFSHCSDLEHMTIPYQYRRLWSNLFYDCPKLTELKLSRKVSSKKPILYPIKPFTFQYKDAILEYERINDCTCRVVGIKAGSGHIQIPPVVKYGNINYQVVTIDKFAFYKYDLISSVDIPDTVTTIEGWAFNQCSNLECISIPINVSSIGPAAFSSCQNLQSFKVANTNPHFVSDGVALFNKSKRTLISYAGGAGGIYRIPNTVMYIYNEAFWGCLGLESIYIPKALKNIDPMTFSGCKNLRSFVVAEGHKSYSAIDGVLYDVEKQTLCRFPIGKQDSFNIPSSVRKIGSQAFCQCQHLTKIDLGTTVKAIGPMAFQDCINLNEIEISDSVYEIGKRAFYNCRNLRNINIPHSICDIAADAFTGTPEKEKVMKEYNRMRQNKQ